MICWPPCIATASERTTASASASGMAPVDCTSPCNQRRVSTSSPSEKLMVAVGSGSGAISVSPFKPTAPKRMLLRRICRASVLMADSVRRASTSSRKPSKSSRLTRSSNSRR